MSEITVQNLHIEYVDEGQGSPVLLLHGWGACKESLGPVYKQLSQAYRVIVPDLPGFGASQEPKEPWDADKYASFVNDFLAALFVENPIAIGHSNGGRILIRAAGTGSGFSKLILVDSAGIKPKRGPAYYMKVYSYKLGKKILSLPGIRKTDLLEKFQKNAGSSDYSQSSPVMRATMTKLLCGEYTADMKRIKAPTLLVWGDRDTATPLSDGQQMEKLIDGSGLVVLKGAGHFSYLDCFGQFMRVIDYFLTH